MTSLPEHWESDYDGNRWFYRYRPTGIVQYTFPKPGDEYPEYIDASAPPLDLPPEEKLVSQQQLKRRSTAERSGSLSNKSKDGSNEVTSATLAKGEGGFWFEPDYMYLGNVSPLQEEIEEELRLVTEQQAKEKAAAAAAAAAAIRTDDGSQPHISPYTSAGTTPLTSNSKPVTGTPEIDGAAVATRESPRNAARAQPTRQSPVGFVAELPSEITAKCREDTHPTPVELPGHHHVSGEESQPAQWVDAFDIAPVELPAQPASVGRREHSDDVRQRPAQLVKSLAHQAPASQHEPRASHPPRDVASSSASGFQPYNPNQRAVAEYNANRRSQVMNQVQPEDVPSILRPPKPPPKQPLDAMANAKQPDTPFLSKAVANSRVPSVLQPARGRPNLPLDTSQNDRQTSPPKTYQPYSPLQERQGNAPSAAEHLSRTNDQQRVGPSHTSKDQHPSFAYAFSPIHRGPGIGFCIRST
ncbi:hypothetical protein B0T16DRAFT_489668 [Cercophora newfieldiana]|uniref:WW domain-containing protein n=1 Tax=Cercophora newfieldiana TaxID=92897 RepID=A0AA39YHP8_9PEZI|nr:hypothetical protein B0T16DRAFT_489668 [Cercophora newfieldiana]